MLVWSQICAGLALYRNQFCSNESTNYFCNRQFVLELNGGCCLRPQGHPFGDKFLRFDRCQSCSCGTFRLVWIGRGYPRKSSSCISSWEAWNPNPPATSWSNRADLYPSEKWPPDERTHQAEYQRPTYKKLCKSGEPSETRVPGSARTHKDSTYSLSINHATHPTTDKLKNISNRHDGRIFGDTFPQVRPGVKHVLAELFVSCEQVVDTQVVLIFALLLERIRDAVFSVPWLLSITMPVGSPFLYLVVRNRKENHCVLNELLILLLFLFARSARTCSRRCRCPQYW